MALVFDGVHNDMFEAAVMAVAAALMLYMSGWLFLKQDPRLLMADLKASTDRAVTSGTALSFAVLAFLAVFREGAETVLFLHALAQSVGGWSLSLVVGLIGASVALAVLFVAMQWFALKLPLRPLFLLTSGFLFVMALKFIGQAVQELQEQLLVPVTAAHAPGWLVDLGLNPSWEAIGLQLLLAVLAVASTGIVFANRNREQAVAAAPKQA